MEPYEQYKHPLRKFSVNMHDESFDIVAHEFTTGAERYGSQNQFTRTIAHFYRYVPVGHDELHDPHRFMPVSYRQVLVAAVVDFESVIEVQEEQL